MPDPSLNSSKFSGTEYGLALKDDVYDGVVAEGGIRALGFTSYTEADRYRNKIHNGSAYTIVQRPRDWQEA